MARAGRRPGQTETRDQILAAARAQFGEHGYAGATIRGIAGLAGVNPALVHHFFGSKEQVFLAALRVPVDPAVIVPSLLDGPRDEFGQRMVRLFLALWSSPESQPALLAMVRSITSNDQAARMMREFIERTVLARVADGLGVPRLRLVTAASQLVGLALFRYVLRIEPMASAADEEVVALVAPVIQHYVD